MNSSGPVQAAMGRRMEDEYDKYWGQWHEKCNWRLRRGRVRRKRRK
jgi:hypothetical protein